ncbi:MAG: cell surface protein SprA [Prolixibacteraceae bacterium]
MKQRLFYIGLLAVILVTAATQSYAQKARPKTAKIDTTGTLIYPFEDEGEFEYPDEIDEKPLYLSRPGNIEWKYEYDPNTRQYIIYEKIGSMYYRMPKTMSLKEFVQYDFDRSIENYWRTRKETEDIEVQNGGLIPQLRIESEAFSNIFGSEIIDIKPQGYVEVQFGLESNYIGDETLPSRLQRTTTFDFENQINLSVNGKIGDKVNLNFNYNTEASFDFENKMKLEYNGKEDEIIRRIEAGNVSLPLNGSLIQGGTNLFGVKTEMQFGKLNVTTVISQNKGESQVVETEGGAQKTSFEIKASDYDENRHFFISKYFRDHYDEALSSLPVIRSQITINKIEVWVTNKSQNFNSARDIVAFVDLGEIDGNIYNQLPEFAANAGSRSPANSANGLYGALTSTYSGIKNSSDITKVLDPLKSRNFKGNMDWEKIDQAKKLSPSEYTLNEKLGFISLNSPLNNDEVLAVAYQYTIAGKLYTVGEFTTSTEESGTTLILKLLKGVSISPNMPTWDLMMKNVYSLGAYELSSEDFDFQVVYKNDSTNTYVTNLPEGELRDTTLLRLMNLDNVNSQLDATPNGDGVFDFIPGITVIKQSGRIIFPKLEPFGQNIRNNISDPTLQNKYAYDSLYMATKTAAEQDKIHDRFAMVGSYKGSSGSEIMLNAFNLAPGSVKVSAGGRPLVEDQDYVVDYAMGRVKIINEGLIEAGSPIQVSTESQELISTQRKTMIGSYASYAFSDKLNLGGTMLWMNERPITNKVDLGEEPVTNMMLGLDFQYRDRSKLLTDIVNLLPFYESDVESSISIEGEVAKLIPGKSKTTGNQVYLDDFEGVETPYSFLSPFQWSLASTPQGQRFSEGGYTDSLAYGYNRAKMAWYYIDRNVFNVASSEMPAHIKADLELRKNHYTREISYAEIFPGKQLSYAMPSYLSVLNLAFYPQEKGPYNFDVKPSKISGGIDQNGKLLKPESRWAGIMREIYTPNFEAANVEYIEFWVLDPFITNTNSPGGDLYFNLGNISEDILKDGKKSFENGLPTSGDVEYVDTTVWGRVSTKQQLGSGFENVAGSREYQDVGLDGLSDTDEASFFSDYLSKLKEVLDPNVFEQVAADPSNDDFKYYRSSQYDAEERSILERYKGYNNPDGNTPTNDMLTESYSVTGKNEPDMEDINSDNTLSETESYYQYRVSIRPKDMVVGKNFIVDKVPYEKNWDDGTKEIVNWYQFKIPIQDVNSRDTTIGDITGFKSIRFMRMFMTNFEDSVILRFGTLNLIRADWRKEIGDLVEQGAVKSGNALFELSSINIEENGKRKPINYVLPPDIEREIDPSNPQPIEMNEQAMLLKVQDLETGDAKAVYKEMGVDMRQYKRLRLEVHAEAVDDEPLQDYDLSFFIRLGSDEDNYYEYEIPLKLTEIPAVSFQNDLREDRLKVWPDENRLDLELVKFSNLKLDRDAEIRKAGSTLSRNQVYPQLDSDDPYNKNILKIKGNPSIGDVEIMHVGIRNPKRNDLPARSAEIWVNELRMSDFDVRGGWASNGRMSVRLADLGNISLAGSTQSVGWGSINQAASQRSLDNKYQFDFAATTELGKLVPEKIGLHMPLFYSISKSVSNPEYDPLSSDIKMADALAVIESPEERDTLLAISQDVITRKSFNINNVSLEPLRKKADRKSWPTDIENFSVSYAKNEQLAHNIDVEKELKRTEKGVFNYNYSMRSQPISPLKNVKFLKVKPLQIISDFNFSVMPEMISFRTDLTRNYNERLSRNNSGFDFTIPTTVQKDFLWNRYFDFRYNLSRSLTIDFTNHNVSRIDEIEGVMDKELYPDEYQLMMDEIYRNLSSFGRPIDYQHSIKISYRVPINKLPLLDWTTATVNYDGDYGWLAGPILATSAGEDPVEIGNTATNGNSMRLNGQLNFTTLYNKVPYLKKINSKYQSTTRSYGARARTAQRTPDKGAKDEDKKKTKEVKYSEKNVSFRADVPKSIFHRLGTNKVKVVVLNERGDTIPGELIVVDINRINFKPSVSIRSGKVYIVGTKEIDESFAEKALGYSVRALLGVRTARVTYSRNGGTELPGFLPEPYLFGMRNDSSTNNILAPSIPFLLGWQDENFALQAASKGWITTDNTIQKQYTYNTTENWNFGVTFEPIPNVNIEFNGSRRQAQNFTSFISFNDEMGDFEMLSGKESGNFDMSILTLKTAFRDRLSDTLKQSAVFNDFRYTNLDIIANRINEARGWDGTGYSRHNGDTIQGVSMNSTDVIIPAFIAAYTGIDANVIPLTARPGLQWIRPNWRINYRGNPKNIDWMKDYVSTLNFTHSYKSNYTVGRYETNLAYIPDENGLNWERNEGSSTFVSELDIASINIQEAFSPLINVDVGFKNDFSTRFEINRSRNLNFDFTNTQLNETVKKEFTVGLGYRFTGMDMIIKSRTKSEKVSNDVNLRFDITHSDYKTTLRRIDLEDGEVNGGSQVLSMDFQADYMVSDKLTVKVYYQYNMNTPHTTNNGYTRSNTKFGLSFNFSIL